MGVIIGAASLVGWIVLAVVAGLILARGRRRALGVVPALVSIVWCGVAAGLMMSGSTSAILIAVPLPPIVSISVMTVGTIPVAAVLLIATIGLRLVRGRGSSSSVAR